ncbi:MAG: hypothetical protein VW962_02895 [Acidimicrobiaceae bacterium]
MEISESNLLPPPDAEQSPVVEGVVDRTDAFPSRRHRKWAIPLAVLSCCAVAAVAVTALVPSSFIAREMNERLGELQPAPYARVPGSAQPVGDRLSVSASEESDEPPPEVFPAVGDFMLVTITEPPQSVLSWWVGRDEGAVEMLTEEDKFGFQTAEQRRVFSLEQMRTAEEVAEYVALSWLGFDAAIVPGDVLISEIACLEFSDAGECVRWPPSDEVLDPGDRLLEADGVELTSVGDLTSALEGKQPGDIITLLVERRGEGEFEADVELTSSPDDPNRTIVGFLPFDTRRVELPFDISIDTGSIGGPSAGLAFTLTVIDGVELLLVPTRQGDEQIAAARAAAPDLEIVAVATLDEAIDVLVAFGGERPNPSS